MSRKEKKVRGIGFDGGLFIPWNMLMSVKHVLLHVSFVCSVLLVLSIFPLVF